MRTGAGFLTGLIFGFGLIVSGMANPAKVLNFLDVFGFWDPSLAFMMLGAIGVAFAGYHFSSGLKAPVFAAEFSRSRARKIDRRLLAGSALFGIGWGLAGFCPGPAVVALVSGSDSVFIFVAAMLGAMAATRAVVDRPNHSPVPSTVEEISHA